jgi:hypothetical protein
VLDIVLAGKQLIKRAIPLLELAHLDPHPRRRAGFANVFLAPSRNEAPTHPITDKIALQPSCQSMLAARCRQTVGNQNQRPVTQAGAIPALCLGGLVERHMQTKVAPHLLHGEHPAPVPSADGADIVALRCSSVRLFTVQKSRQLLQIKVRSQKIFAPEIDDGAMLGFALLIAKRFNQAHVFVLDPIAASGSDHAQEHGPLSLVPAFCAN